MITRKKGQVLVLFALAAVVLLGFAALGIDVGFLYSTRHELQRSADTGALAGASAFLEGDWSTTPIQDLATARAVDFATRDTVVTSALAQGDVTVGFPSQDRIRVTTSRNVNLFFARILGRNQQLVTATAVAEAAVADTGVRCLKPWGAPLPWDDFTLGNPATDNNQKYDAGETVYSMADLDDGYKMILKVGEPFNNPNNIDLSSLQQESGHFFALELCDDSGGNDYRNRIANVCLDDCSVAEGDSVNIKTGNTVGPTKQGVDELIALDPGASYNESTHEVDGSIEPNWRDSKRLVKIPLYNPQDLLNQGNVDMIVAEFAGFFVQGYDTQQGTVVGYYVSDDASGATSETGPSPGPSLKVLRLVE